MAISGSRQGTCQTTSSSQAASTRQSVTAVALKLARGSHNQDRGPESPHAAARHDRSSQATPHFLRHAPAIDLGPVPGRWGVTKGSQDAAWFLRFAGICPNCVARVTYSPPAGDAQPAPRVGRFDHSAIRR
jgi:hypothetical protein